MSPTLKVPRLYHSPWTLLGIEDGFRKAVWQSMSMQMEGWNFLFFVPVRAFLSGVYSRLLDSIFVFQGRWRRFWKLLLTRVSDFYFEDCCLIWILSYEYIWRYSSKNQSHPTKTSIFSAFKKSFNQKWESEKQDEV